MRKIFSYIVLLLAAISCEKQQGEDSGSVNRTDSQLCKTITFSIEVPSTKAYSGFDAQEISVSHPTFLAFNSYGDLLAAQTSSSGLTSSMVLPYGEVTLRFFGNVVPSLFNDVCHISQLDELVYKYYDSQYYDRGFLPMSGSYSFKVDENTSNLHSVTLDRYHSRFCLLSISNRLKLSNQTELPMTVKAVYLTNIQGSVFIDDDRNTDLWYSKFGRPDDSQAEEDRIDSAEGLVTGSHSFRAFDKVLKNGQTLNMSSSPVKFYAFPNHTELDCSGWMEVFTERQTRMVLAAEIKGVVYYYPVNLVNMRRNTTYDVNFIITRLGSLDPDSFIFVDEEDLDVDKDITIDFGGFDDGGDITIVF